MTQVGMLRQDTYRRALFFGSTAGASWSFSVAAAAIPSTAVSTCTIAAGSTGFAFAKPVTMVLSWWCSEGGRGSILLEISYDGKYVSYLPSRESF